VLACLLAGVWFGSLTRSVNADERDLVCLSLGAAQKELVRGENPSPEVAQLGYITRPVALVVDPVSRDCVLVGRIDPLRPALYLDDLAVALRSVYIDHDPHGPGVSIEAVTSVDEPDREHLVRYFAGIAHTRFGKVCFESDYLLKQMELGLAPTGSPGVESTWDLWQKKRNPGEGRGGSRLVSFFYPLDYPVRFDVNAVSLGDYRLAVGTAGSVPSDGALHDSEGLQFVRALNEHYDEVCRFHPVLADLENLMGLYSLCQGLDSLEIKPHLGFWLKTYLPRSEDTPRTIPTLHRGSAGLGYSIVVNGDLGIRRGLIIRMRLGDPWAIGRVVLQGRPARESLLWTIRISGSTVQSGHEAAAMGRRLRGLDHLGRDEFGLAREDFQSALAEGDSSAEVERGLAQALLGSGDSLGARHAADLAVRTDPASPDSWRVRGEILARCGADTTALASLRLAVDLAPADEAAGCALGDLLARRGDRPGAMVAYSAVLLENPTSTRALLGRGSCHRSQGDYPQARLDWEAAAASATDSDMRDQARQALQELAAEGHLPVSPLVDLLFPRPARHHGRSLWTLEAYAQGDYDFGRDFFAPAAAYVLDNHAFRVTLPARTTWISGNNLRLSLEIPLVVEAVPREELQCVGGPGAKAVCPGSVTTAAVLAGAHGPSLFLSRLWLDGLWNQPLLVTHLGVSAPGPKPWLETYLGEDSPEGLKGSIPFQRNTWLGKAAVQAELPAAAGWKMPVEASCQTELAQGKSPVLGLSVGMKKALGRGARDTYLGARVAVTRTRWQRLTEVSLTYDALWSGEWQTFAVGVGRRTTASQVAEDYVAFSTGIGFKIFRAETWF
jgi:tetratricopeptide (TPR) repeat protein